MKRPSRLALFPLLAAIAIAGAATLASAAGMLPAPKPAFHSVLFGFGGGDQQQQQDAPQVHEIHDDASFQKKTKAYSMMPYNKADLEFEMYLPSDWTPEEVAIGSNGGDIKITGEVARFRSPMIGTQFVNAAIEVLKLDYEISARNWLKNHILTSGFLPQGDVTEINNRSASGAYLTTTEGESKFVYCAARISGSYVVIAKFETPLNLRGYVAYLQKKSIDSFKLLYPKDDPIEEQKVFTVVDAIKFNYPASWKVSNPDFRDMNRLTVELRNFKPGYEVGKSAQTQGYIRMFAIRRQRTTDLMTEIENLRKYFTDTMNLEFKKMISTGKSDAYARFIFNRYEVYDVINKGVKGVPTVQEVHVVVLGDKEWYVLSFLYTPKEAELPTWARNVQSFQEVIKSVK